MGTIFEELIRRFNEENNEEAGEHFTPRDVVQLMADLIFLPIADAITDATYLVYDGACGTGGMLTVAAERLDELAVEHGKDVSIHLYGQEVNDETYAITKADLLLKGEGEEADHIGLGSTLSQDQFPSLQFDFMLSNPPYGKSWKRDLETMGGKDGMHDARFVTQHRDNPALSLVTRTSDGQMLFLVNLLSKMKTDTPLGSRIAEVHNGSALFTGDAGQGESNIRRWIIENDWLEAVIALPLNMFYNTGIATYIWVLSNRKTPERQGKVQLIDATGWFRPLRRNLGAKNCELGPADIARIMQAYLTLEESEQSKFFPNESFGYWKIITERPLRYKNIDPNAQYSSAQIKQLKASGPPDPEGIAVIRKKYGLGQAAEDSLHGRIEIDFILSDGSDSYERVVDLEPDPDLRDTEQVPLLTPGGIQGFMEREVWPYSPDAWVDPAKTQIGYEISFTRHFYKPKPLRTLAEIRADIEALEHETDGLLDEILVEVVAS